MPGETHVPIDQETDIVTARQKGRELAALSGLSKTEQTLIATAISEVVAATLARAVGREIHLQYNEVFDRNERGRDAVDKARSIHRKLWGL